METGSHIQAVDGASRSIGAFFADIYMWMFYGLMISAFTSYVTLHSSIGATIFANPVFFYGISAIEIAIILAAQFMINKLPVELSRGLFFVYAALNGVTLSWIFVQYTSSSVLGVFLISAGIFAGLAIVGYTTKKDLSSWGTVLFVGMIGVFIASIVNIFLQNSMMDTVVSGIAILVFCGLTVYDNQAYKAMYHQTAHDDDALKKQATLGALHMYINFIMIFVNLLKFFGASRD